MDDATNSTNLPRARVLVVDDHPGTAAMLARAIGQSAEGIEVVSATSGEKALECLGGDTVDLLITDMMMPNMNGLQLIEKLQSQPAGRPGYTVLITGYDIPGLRESARRLKVNETIIKPIRPERICEIVGKVLDQLDHGETLEPAGGNREPSKILVVDDNADNVELLTRYLDREGYDFVTAADGVAALEKARSESPDLVLLDVNMPEKDGFAVLREIREDPVLQRMAVIILTAARPDPADIHYGLNLGADDYVTKPFDRRELLARIRTKLRVKESEDAIRRRYGDVRVLPEIGKDLSGRLDLADLADVVLRRAVETFGALYGHIIIKIPSGQMERTYRVAEEPPDAGEPLHLGGVMRQVESQRQSIIIEDARKDSRWPGSPEDHARSAVLVPIEGRFDLIGVLVLTHEQRGYFKPDDLLLLQAITSQAAIAVENARLHSRLTAEHDQLADALGCAPAAILVFDWRAALVFMNSAGERLFAGCPARLGEPLEPGQGYDALIQMLEEARGSGESRTQEVTWRDERIFSTQLTPMPAGGWIADLHDVSYLKGSDRPRQELTAAAAREFERGVSGALELTAAVSKAGRLNHQQVDLLHRLSSAIQDIDALAADLLGAARGRMENVQSGRSPGAGCEGRTK